VIVVQHVLPCPWRRLLFRLCIAAAITVPAITAEALAGRVVSVHDGDTLTALDANNVQHKVRLNGIDAPEIG
jgi:endonuclease YncB( thermonuclease family)